MRDDLAARAGNPVEYLGPSSAVEDFLAALDVFVLTSDREGCPNVILEAMACGRAVVTTDAGGAGEVVRDGVTGYVVPRGDRAALTERVLALLEDAALRERIGRAARLDVEERFGLDRMVTETVRLYRRAAGVEGRAVAA
jgi:glycosyltransferase involved in cell wall biosynthesis